MQELAGLLDEKKRRFDRTRFFRFYPDNGPLRRDLYDKHLEFFGAGIEHQERAFIAANRSGKSTAAAFEGTCHLTGKYPEWWKGCRFKKPVTMWAAGEDSKTVRETVQVALFGPPGALGTGMIPGASIVGTPAARSGVPEAIDSATILHLSGRHSRLVLKSYDQGREAFQGAKIDVGWADEEPPISVYTEFLTRTMATVPGEENGRMMCTFTPLKGWSDVVKLFLKSEGLV